MEGVRLESLGQFCGLVSLAPVRMHNTNGQRHTLDLLEPLAVAAADLGVLLLQYLETSLERICDFQTVVLLRLIIATGLIAVERGLHLPDRRDDSLRFLHHFLFLGRHQTNLVVQGFGQSLEELRSALSGRHDQQSRGLRRQRALLPLPPEHRAHGWRRRFHRTSHAAGQLRC